MCTSNSKGGEKEGRGRNAFDSSDGILHRIGWHWASNSRLPFRNWGGREGQDHHLDQGASGSWQAFVYRGLRFLPCRRRHPNQPECWPSNWGVEWCPAKPSDRRGIGGLLEQSYHLWWTQGLVEKVCCGLQLVMSFHDLSMVACYVG